MSAPRRWILAMAATVVMAGCSNSPDDPRPASAAPSSSSPSSARPATTAASAVCLDLPTFVDPLFGKDVNPAFDAVDRYECGDAGARPTPD